MNYDDLIKDRDGLRDHAGRAASLTLKNNGDQPGMVWLRKNRFGATARNRGGKLEVRSGAAKLAPGYMSYGHVSTDTLIHACLAFNAFGPYLDRSGFAVDTGFSPDSVIPFYYYGRGFGSTATTAFKAYGTDFNNRTVTRWNFNHYTTWDGSSFEAGYKTEYVTPNFGPGVSYETAISPYPGSINGSVETMTGHASVGLDGDQYKHFLLIDNGLGAQPTQSPVITLPYQLPNSFHPFRTGPNSLVAIGQYFRPLYDQWNQPHSIDMKPESCPGFLLQYSNNNGGSWTQGDVSGWYKEFNDTVMTLLPNIDTPGWQPGDPVHTDTRNSGYFNYCVYFAALNIAAISPTVSAAMGVCPYIEVVSGPPHAPDVVNYKGKVKVGVLVNGNLTEGATLFDGALNVAAAVFGGLLPVKGGAVAQYNAPDAFTTSYIYTPDGYSWAFGPDTGVVASNVGFLNGFGVGRLDVVRWDGQYSIYESRDMGVTWTRKGTLTSKGPPPSGTYAYLINYGSVTHLRENGLPAGASQTAPWITNTKFAP